MTGIQRLRKLIEDYRAGRECDGFECTELSCGKCMAKNVLEPIADQIERETQPKRDAAEDVSVSAYDLLPEEDSDAIAWVREHGGIAEVRDAWNMRSNLDRQLEKAQAKVERQQRHIESIQGKLHDRRERICELNRLNRDYRYALNGVCEHLGLTDGTGLPDMPEVIWTELDRRLMPEGMEWLVEAWPRFEDDAPVRFGEEAMGFSHKPPFVIDHVTLFDGGEVTVCAEADHDSGKVENFVRVLPGERVRRPDSFEQLDKDANDLIYDIGFHLGDYSPSDFKEKGDSVQDRVRDLVRRAKALAERDR